MRVRAMVTVSLSMLAAITGTTAGAQRSSVSEKADAIVEAMADRPEWLVGQVCMVGVWGNNFDHSPEIRQKWEQTARLVQEYHVGNVILFETNFSNVPKPGVPSTPEQIASICQDLQRLSRETATKAGFPSLPLFISVDEEGDGPPWTRVRYGLTPIPSNMAIGATWDLELAERIGETLGSELATLGINMLLGPVLDINANVSKDAMGERCFGGNPCWAGRMGRAYIRGVHRGAAGQGQAMAVVAKHWPGHGDCDRLPDYEVARINSTFEDLGNKELVPFLMVTNAPDPEARPDGLMPTHSVYTRLQTGAQPFPLTLDMSGDVIGTLVEASKRTGGSPRLREELAKLAQWREQGLIVSDALGCEGLITEYRSRGRRGFPYGDAAYRCLLAGQDVVMLAGYGKWQQQIKAIEYLTAMYRRGSTPTANEAGRRFCARVQDAARRVIETKLRVLGDDPSAKNAPTTRSTADAAQKLRPLVAAHINEIYEASERSWADAVQWIKDAGAPGPPDDATIVTVEPRVLDGVALRRVQRGLVADLIMNRDTRVPGSSVERLNELEVRAFLRSTEPELAARARQVLGQAQWVIIVLGHRPRTPSAVEEKGGIDSVRWSRELIRELPVLYPGAQRPRVAVIACQVPYYLEESDIAAVDSYLITHTKLERYLELAINALFGAGSAAPLASPVSVPGARYDLADVLKPQPGLEVRPEVECGPKGVPRRVLVGPLTDTQGRPVPDGLEVRFLLRRRGGQSSQEDFPPELVGQTIDGTASCELPEEVAGALAALQATANGWSSEWVQISVPRPRWPLPLILVAIALSAAGGALVWRWHKRRERDYARVPEVLYTFLAVDVRGSTALKTGQDPVSVRRTFDAYHGWVRRTASAHNGEVYSTSGDGVLCRFARATEAVAAARELRSSLDAFNTEANLLPRPVTIGMGLHTGPLLATGREDHGTVSSATLDVAMKIQAQAEPGEILVSAETATRLALGEELRDAGTVLGEMSVYRVP